MTAADRAVIARALAYIDNPCMVTLPSPEEREHLKRLATGPTEATLGVGTASSGGFNSYISPASDESGEAKLPEPEPPARKKPGRRKK